MTWLRTPQRETWHLLRKLGRNEITRMSQIGSEHTASLLTLAGRDAASAAAVRDFLKAIAATSGHGNPLAVQALADAQSRLRPLIKSLPRETRQMIEVELEHRALLTLTSTEELEALVAKSRQRITATGLDAGTSALAGLMHRQFKEQIRELLRQAAKRAVSIEEAALVGGYRRLTTVIGDEWRQGWSDIYAYLCNNADAIARRGKDIEAATAAQALVHQAGDAFRMRAAAKALDRARDSLGGYRNKIKGLVFEAYVPRWDGWLQVINRAETLAQAQLRELAGNRKDWTSRRVIGSLRLDGREIWDEAVILTREAQAVEPAQAVLVMSGQYKAQKLVTGPGQIPADWWREFGGETSRGRAPVLSFHIDGKPQLNAYNLVPSPSGAASLRYLATAAGGSFPADLLTALARHNIAVQQLSTDLGNTELDQIVDALVRAVLAARKGR